jgi:hypothetical protein
VDYVAAGETAGDLDSIAADIRHALDASVVILNRDFSLRAYHAMSTEIAGDRIQSIVGQTSGTEGSGAARFEKLGLAFTTRPVRIQESSAGGPSSIICIPLRHRGAAYGFLFAHADADNTISDADLEALMPLAAHAGTLLAAEESNQGISALARLFEGDADDEAAIRTVESANLLRDDEAFTVLAVDAPTVALPAEVVRVPMGRRTALVMPDGDSTTMSVQSLAQACAAHGATVGVGGTYTDISDARRSWLQARVGISVIRQDPSMGPVTYWDSIGAYRLTAVASAEAIAEAAITPAVRSLLEHRNTDLRSTAEIYLAHAGDAAAATAELNIHRQTLYYRLSRIEDLTGLDLAVGAHRLELHLGLFLGKFLGQFPRP